MPRKERSEIPAEVAARVLFLSDRTCCVCREGRKPIQIHHLNEDPSNSEEANLAVLCLECHRDTQIRGGFDRKLDAHQIVLYREDWNAVVDRRRHGTSASTMTVDAQSLGIASLWQKAMRVKYLQLSEKDEEDRYSFSADYPQLDPESSMAASEANLILSAFVTSELQKFRSLALSTSAHKAKMDQAPDPHPSCWDDLSITHSAAVIADDLLAVEFRISSYGAGAAHPNHKTQTYNFLLEPSLLLELANLFRPESEYLGILSRYCITDLHAHQTPFLKAQRTGETDSWILEGAAPKLENFESFLLVKGGLRIFFDPYRVSSYAEGRREVFVPLSEVREVLLESIVKLLS
jgi:Protein of unknown function (DUF3298)